MCRAAEEREGAGRGEGMFSRRQVEEGDLPLSWVQVRHEQCHGTITSDHQMQRNNSSNVSQRMTYTSRSCLCLQEMAGDVPRAALLSSLDATWDSLKRLARLELKAINPVAAVLNLLPINWDARIVKVITVAVDLAWHDRSS